MVHQVDCLVFGAVLLALYLVSSIDQTSSSSVADTDACEGFKPIYGGALLHHVYQTLKLPGSIYCLRACDDDIRCQSINHVVHGEICELNNRTKEARPEDFTTDVTKVYMKKFRKRGRWRRFEKKSLSLSRMKPGFLVGYFMMAVQLFSGSSIIFEKMWCDVGWKEALKQSVIERFDKTIFCRNQKIFEIKILRKY